MSGVRRHNAIRVAAAAEGAARADEWIARAAAERALCSLGTVKFGRAVRQRVLETRRVRRHLFDAKPRLFNLFLEYPELAPWFRTPRALRSLADFAGAHRSAGLLRTVVARDAVTPIVRRLGRRVWLHAISQPVDVRGVVLDSDPDRILERIDVEGGAATSAYLSERTGDLYPAIEHALGVNWSSNRALAGPQHVAAVGALVSEIDP